MEIKNLLSLLACVLYSFKSFGYNDGYIQYQKVELTSDEKQVISESLKSEHWKYDPQEKMLTSILGGWNYHTDAQSGVFHQVRESFSYAVSLLDLGDTKYTQRAFDIIEKTISLQDQDTSSKSCGVWPYYMEEPLATKRSPIDFNWADFNAVSLLDVWMGHQEKIPEALKTKIKHALILAAKSIQKRNVDLGYTNIAIMGIYVTYMVSHLFDIPEMIEYSGKRLENFYEYTLNKGGFSEYNSPTYTIVALDELERMKQHIVEPCAKQIIDKLYYTGWEMIARHYYKHSGQWAGPHSRSYSTLVRPTFYSILNQGSNGQIHLGIEEKPSDVKVKHQIPTQLLHYFFSPVYPRTETDIFEKVEPQIIGTSYMTNTYAISTTNRSSLWNQRRPFLVYWGELQKPKYLQVRLLHDNYDFSSAIFYSQQKKNNVLAAINFVTNGGDKHISIDRLKNGKFKAKDIRLRFEFGNCSIPENLILPNVVNKSFSFVMDKLQFNIQLYEAAFGTYKGHWQKGSDKKDSWVDFVIYSGEETEFDLTKIYNAVLGFTFSIQNLKDLCLYNKPNILIKDNRMNVNWNGLTLNILDIPYSMPNHL